MNFDELHLTKFSLSFLSFSAWPFEKEMDCNIHILVRIKRNRKVIFSWKRHSRRTFCRTGRIREQRDDLTYPAGCRKTADIFSLHSRKTIWLRLVLYVHNVRNEFAPFATHFRVHRFQVSVQLRAVQIAAQIRVSLRLARSLFFLSPSRS